MQNTLYTVTDIFASILDNIEIDENGEVLNAELLEQAKADFDLKVENVALYIKNMTALRDMIKSEQDELNKRRKTLENKAELLKNYLTEQLERVGLKKYESGRVKISFRKSESIDIIDESELEEKYIRTKITHEADKTAIKEAIKSGETVAGAILAEKQNMQIK